MLDLEPDPTIFLEDFGEPVTASGVTGLGIYNAPGEYQLDDGAILINESILVETSIFGGLRYEDLVEVEGRGFYTVREPIPQGDGAFMLLTLQPTTAQPSLTTWMVTEAGFGMVTEDGKAMVLN